MSMHLEGPWLSMSGKKKGKKKFRNADEARKSRELDESWKEIQKKWGMEQDNKRKTRALSAEVWKPEPSNYRGKGDPKIPSLPFTGGSCTKAPNKVYTGSKMLGIGTMHKSNAVPIFSDDEARDISSMRR